MNAHIAYVSIGSNMGDALENCRTGILALEESGASVITGRSHFYKTEPVDYTDQDWFVNAAVRMETRLRPAGLLTELNAIERRFGRDRKSSIRFGPRPLDMDIIFYDDLILNTSDLILPHPRMDKRRFVLQPICDIDPTCVHPVFKRNMQYLLAHLDDEGQGMTLCE
ncbi:2-amino-4-hydroxy-6-hydroxymethyldihydropteridin e diphosphokinase [Desulfonema ishimotonii]|uniref:2-amino-4-hydroxy-6-hydroxymethyldihydropteridine pyrophosphokinase n=1 Tax=Desulfonema ishimotonii TaxID=45657 RepID=A0A401FT83_9BACT|nr:2-amino-4-hydroxy-6-hydroxymethyldihydropteridin e diphosphokinase [Desulfonema ishimotonii]